MSVLLHPTISWQGWQQVKRSSAFKRLTSNQRIHLVNQLPHTLWAWEMGDSREIDDLLKSLRPELKEND
ncbi:MAG: hypothetical protein L3J63_07410 [Geopsychrobacter sp.]|nr:hypothetical protein [Geopsychrobacter sp.]